MLLHQCRHVLGRHDRGGDPADSYTVQLFGSVRVALIINLRLDGGVLFVEGWPEPTQCSVVKVSWGVDPVKLLHQPL